MADTLAEAMAQATTEDAGYDVLTISNDLRTISVPADFVLGVYQDEDVHRVYFKMPRMYGETDLSKYSTVRVNYQNANGEGDYYTVEDKTADGDSITFSWLVGRFAFASAGQVRFSVCIRLVDSAGTVTNEFNTTVVSVPVLEGLETDSALDTAVQDAMVKAENAAERAKKSAASASDSAERAASSASEAKASADSVKASADTIQTNSDDIGNLKNQIDAANEKITALQTLTKMLSASGASRANSFIYEYDLGTSFTAEQSADIRSGRFDKVRVGGYWTINGHKYWAGHADYRLHCGEVDHENTIHHMLVFPDKSFYNHVMNSTNVTTGAYYGSDMVSDGLTQALATVMADFGESHVLIYRNLLANAVSGNSSSNWAWYDRQIDLMNECMVYGHQAWGAAARNGYDIGCDKSQIALFQARPDLIVNRENWWLRDVQGSTSFCGIADIGHVTRWGAGTAVGVRPAFLIA